MRNVGPLRVYIIEQARPQPGDEAGYDIFTRWSLDDQEWQPFPSGLHQVTGSAQGTRTFWAMVLDQLEPQGGQRLDLWDYSTQGGAPIRFGQGDHAVYARRTPSQGEGMVSHNRRIIAVARLCAPYFVYISP
jgi:hypothetical protein